MKIDWNMNIFSWQNPADKERIKKLLEKFPEKLNKKELEFIQKYNQKQLLGLIIFFTIMGLILGVGSNNLVGGLIFSSAIILGSLIWGYYSEVFKNTFKGIAGITLFIIIIAPVFYFTLKVLSVLLKFILSF